MLSITPHAHVEEFNSISRKNKWLPCACLKSAYAVWFVRVIINHTHTPIFFGKSHVIVSVIRFLRVWHGHGLYQPYMKVSHGLSAN